MQRPPVLPTWPPFGLISGKSQQPVVLTSMAQVLWCSTCAGLFLVCGVGQTIASPARLRKTGDCKSKSLIFQGVPCLICADQDAGIMQHNKMNFRKTLTCNASWQPFRHTQAKPTRVGTHSTKFQPDEAFGAQQTLVEAGYRPRQAQGLLRVVGGVLKPLALQLAQF